MFTNRLLMEYNVYINNLINSVRTSALEAGITDENVIKNMISEFIEGDQDLALIQMMNSEEVNYHVHAENEEENNDNNTEEEEEEEDEYNSDEESDDDIIVPIIRNVVIPIDMNMGIVVTMNEILDRMGPEMIYEDKVNVTLSDKDLNSLTDINYQDIKNIQKDEKCSICLVELADDHTQHKYIQLKCDHTFHSECIKIHLSKYSYHCPMCRQPCGKSQAHL